MSLQSLKVSFEQVTHINNLYTATSVVSTSADFPIELDDIHAVYYEKKLNDQVMEYMYMYNVTIIVFYSFLP